jgi:PAS domain S-box-containing protein
MNDLDTADPNIQTAIFEAVAEGLSAGVLLYDRNDLIVFASQHFAALLSVPKDMLVPGRRMRDLVAALYDAGIRFTPDGNRRPLSREDWISEQISSLWKERSETLERPGADRWLSISRRRLSSGYGVCVVKDVSEQKKREEQWRHDNERVQVTEEVLDNLPFPLSVKDRHGTFVAVNRAHCDFLELHPDAILGHKGADINPPALEQRLGPINREVYESGEPVQLPERITRPDGTQSVVVVHKYRIGKPGRYYLVTAKQDLSAFVAANSENRQSVPTIRDEDFVDTDLTRTDGILAVVEDGEPSINDAKVLVVSSCERIETSALDILSRGGVDASSVSSADELSMFLQLASEADIVIDLVIVDSRMSADIFEIVDAHGLAALRFDPARIERELPILVQAEIKRLAEAVVPSPSEDCGTIVAPQSEIDILVAEDNEVNQIVFSQIIEGFGYRYALAVDGEEAVRLCREHSPRLVLMDVTLPKLNGFEAAAAIRALETEGGRVPIVGVLAHAFDRDRESCAEAGMDEVILKPISPEALENVFTKFLVDGSGNELVEETQRAQAL